jgi:hypothetical protein
LQLLLSLPSGAALELALLTALLAALLPALLEQFTQH